MYDSLYRLATKSTHPRLTQRAVKTGTWIYQPRPTSASRNDHPVAFNDSTDLSFPQWSSSCIQRLDRPQLPATIVQLHSTTRPISAYPHQTCSCISTTRPTPARYYRREISEYYTGINAHKTEYMCYNQTGDITTLDGTPLKLVDKFTYLGSSVSSTEKDIDTRLTKEWIAIDKLLIIWKSDLTDKMKCSFFQAAVVSILLYGCTTWTLTKQLEKKLDGNYTRMLRAKHQLFGHLPPIAKTIQVRRTRHAGRAHKWCTPMDPHIWPGNSRTTSSNIHSAAMWGYGM